MTQRNQTKTVSSIHSKSSITKSMGIRNFASKCKRGGSKHHRFIAFHMGNLADVHGPTNQTMYSLFDLNIWCR